MTSATDSLEDLAPREDPYLGATLARRYRVLRRLGGGGMGTVYEAEHLVIGRRVAVKLLHSRPTRPTRPPCAASSTRRGLPR